MLTPTKRQKLQKRINQFTPETVKKVRLEELDETNKSTTMNDSSIDSNKLESLQHMFTDVSNVSQVNQHPKNDLNISFILSKPSLRERFSNFLLGEQEILKKSKYLYLVDLLSVVDLQLSFMKQREIPTFFLQLQQNIKDNSRIEISLSQIQQIKQVWNEAYSMIWMENQKSISKGKQDIQINFIDMRQPSSKILDERKTNFKNLLTAYLTVYGDFIEDYPLPQQAKIQDNQSHQITSILRNFSYQALNQNHDLNGTINIAKYSNLSIKNTGLSDRLLKKIQEKEKQSKLQEVIPMQYDSEQVQQVVSIIYNYYLVRNVSNMFLVNVIKYVTQNKLLVVDQSKVKLIIETITSKCPNWLSLVNNPAGMILRVNKSVNLPTLFTQLEL